MYRLTIALVCFFVLGLSNLKADSVLSSEKPSKAVLMSAGVANEVYLVPSSASEPHVLKIFNRKSLNDLQRSELLLQRVRSSGINVPNTIIPPLEIGSKIISVSSYINGRHIDDTHLSEAAKLMANLHRIKIDETTVFPLKNYTSLFDRCKSWNYCEILKAIFSSLDLSYLDSIPQGLIHGDFSYTNLLVDKNNNLSLIDFDHLRNDVLLTDLVRCHLFYGFDQEGRLKETAIRTFVSAYNHIRPLTSIELNTFYTHLKLCLIDVALEMYDHMYIKKDLPVERVIGNPFNACLNPDLIAKEVLSIGPRTSLAIDDHHIPIFFFGLSGVGKTTLIHFLAESSDLFYIPKFTVTRPLRTDDDARYFEYVSADEFLKLKESGEFFVWMNQEGTYYGYRFKNLTDPNRFPLLNASAYGIDMINYLRGVKVLIQGDSQRGLLLRRSPEIAKTREKTNRIAYERFFGQEGFQQKMDIVFFNEFGNPLESAQQLKRQILEKINHAN